MLEQLLTGPYLMFLAVLLWSAVMMRRAAVKTRQSRERDIAKEWQSELRTRQRSAEVQIQQLEIRLHDYDRDVSARVQSTMLLLDQMIAEADREIGQLETLLEQGRADAQNSLSPEHRRMVVHLAGAGYSKDQIARLIGRPEQVVAEVLDRPERKAA